MWKLQVVFLSPGVWKIGLLLPGGFQFITIRVYSWAMILLRQLVVSPPLSWNTPNNKFLAPTLYWEAHGSASPMSAAHYCYWEPTSCPEWSGSDVQFISKSWSMQADKKGNNQRQDKLRKTHLWVFTLMLDSGRYKETNWRKGEKTKEKLPGKSNAEKD